MPARARFLKSARAEMARIKETIHRFGVSNPEVEFRLSHSGKFVAAFPAGMGRRERIAKAYGRDLLTEMIEADVSTVSKHLALLRNAGVVQDDKRGNQVFYSLRCPCILNFFSCVETVIESVAREQVKALG